MLQAFFFLSSVFLRPCRPRTTRAAAALGTRRPQYRLGVSSHTYLPGTWLAGLMVHQIRSTSRQTYTPSSACETAHIARRSHGQNHGSWEGRFLQVVLTGGTRLGESLIRRLIELKSRPVLGSFDPFITWTGCCCPSARWQTPASSGTDKSASGSRFDSVEVGLGMEATRQPNVKHHTACTL